MFIFGCFPSKNTEPASQPAEFDKPPAWAKEAIWYQIFVERFRNGNPANNPTKETCAGALIDPLPENWAITPWGHNWYQQEDWAQSTGLDFYRTIQMRRYGGDLAGVMEKIPYLKELGITAIYFNPINDAPSLHKYDARHYHHVDVTFGNDIAGDLEIISKENPYDPSTWQWTSADKLFLQLVEKLHKEGIRVVLDFSWNHTGNQFWAFKDIEKNLENSEFKDWYHTEFYTDESTGEKKFRYEGWYGISSLPELRKVDTEGKRPGLPYEGNLEPKVKEHIYAVTKRWMDPYGKGDFSKGIDGMRLDVAEHVPVGFWRDFRKYVRSVNPDFFLIGENWWTNWPDELMDPAPWVKGDIFDAVMHYQWFKVARGYFSEPIDRVNIIDFKRKIDSVFLKYPDYTQQSMMNLASSHDSPRLLSSFFNINKYKHSCKPSEDPQYRTNRPGQVTFDQVKLFLLHQFTFVGAPHIWAGDEMGMTGADDPDNRKPLVWKDITFEKETPSVYSKYDYSEKPVFDEAMFQYIKSLISLRKQHKALTFGTYRFIDAGHPEVLMYSRNLGEEEVLVIFNNNETPSSVKLSENYRGKIIFNYNFAITDFSAELLLPPYSGIVIQKN
ncbi:MAG: alpha-glucosidase C-terminal domain-containing protein [Saprospiraceae bacterium]|nr:alpha-glucosidase C-terminal domain-containing protein [Saprospiraceae bacterium]